MAEAALETQVCSSVEAGVEAVTPFQYHAHAEVLVQLVRDTATTIILLCHCPSVWIMRERYEQLLACSHQSEMRIA